VVVVLGLDHGQRDVGLEEQGVVGPEHRRGITLGPAAAHDDPPGSQRELAVDLHHAIPAGLFHGWPDELVADVALGQGLLVHSTFSK
jgi:hypothetical protein